MDILVFCIFKLRLSLGNGFTKKVLDTLLPKFSVKRRKNFFRVYDKRRRLGKIQSDCKGLNDFLNVSYKHCKIEQTDKDGL